VEYTSLELRQIALEQIRVLPAQLEVTDLLHPILTAQGSPPSAITLPSIFGHTFHYHDHPDVYCNSYSIRLYSIILLDGFWSGGQQNLTLKRFSSKLKIVWKCCRNTTLLLLKLYYSTLLILQFSKRETHIHDISNTYVSFPHLFAEGKSLKSVGTGMPRDKKIGSTWQ
jgi:hypothetical protein